MDGPEKRAPRTTRRLTYFITAANKAIGRNLCSKLLEDGHRVISGIVGLDTLDGSHSDAQHSAAAFLQYMVTRNGLEPCQTRLQIVHLDAGRISHCQSVVAMLATTVGCIDVFCLCDGQTVVGSVEELGATVQTRGLITRQFDTNFFGPVNLIRAVLVLFRKQMHGHIILLSATTGHLGTPGLGLFCASQWAIEGYCDSLAYEVAPFNVKISIVQPNLEVSVFANKLAGAPVMAPYAEDAHPAPLARYVLAGLLQRLGCSGSAEATHLRDGATTDIHPGLTSETEALLVEETVKAIIMIGGHDNPPTRHIVGHDGVSAVKEKLKTLSEELEDFSECSAAVDHAVVECAC